MEGSLLGALESGKQSLIETLVCYGINCMTCRFNPTPKEELLPMVCKKGKYSSFPAINLCMEWRRIDERNGKND